MGQKSVKRIKKLAEKVAHSKANEMAENQLLDLMNAPFSLRWIFAMSILFPKKQFRDKKKIAEYKAKSYGYKVAKSVIDKELSNGKEE